jgi:hypothetical protein
MTATIIQMPALANLSREHSNDMLYAVYVGDPLFEWGLSSVVLSDQTSTVRLHTLTMLVFKPTDLAVVHYKDYSYHGVVSQRQ